MERVTCVVYVHKICKNTVTQLYGGTSHISKRI